MLVELVLDYLAGGISTRSQRSTILRGRMSLLPWLALHELSLEKRKRLCLNHSTAATIMLSLPLCLLLLRTSWSGGTENLASRISIRTSLLSSVRRIIRDLRPEVHILSSEIAPFAATGSPCRKRRLALYTRSLTTLKGVHPITSPLACPPWPRGQGGPSGLEDSPTSALARENRERA